MTEKVILMSRYKLNKDNVIEVFEEGALVLNLRDRRLLELNSGAATIVSLLDGKRTLEQVADEIAKDHDISHDYPITQIVQDVLELCSELYRDGILELQPHN